MAKSLRTYTTYSRLCPVCKGTGEKLPVVIRNCKLTDITCPRCDGTGRA